MVAPLEQSRAQAPNNEQKTKRGRIHGIIEKLDTPAKKVGAGIGAVAVTIAAYKGLSTLEDKVVQAGINEAIGLDKVASAPQDPTIYDAQEASIDSAPLDPATTDPEIFRNQPYEKILSETVPYLEERREESLRKIDEYFTSRGEGSIAKRDEILFKSEENMNAQDIERQIAADTYTITEIAIEHPVLAKNLAMAVFKNPNSYEVFVENDLDGMKHATNIQVFAVSPELTGGKFGEHVIDGPSLVLLSGNMLLDPKPDGNLPLMNRVVTKYTYGENRSHYALTYQVTETSSEFVEYPENIVP